MAKIKKAFFCKNCGNESPQWLGQCPSCNEWNTLIEEIISKEKSQQERGSFLESKVKKSIPINEVDSLAVNRIKMPGKEFNRVLGGGLVPGSLVLLGGEPGIGKSTLLLQVAMKLTNKKILYVSGEESLQQIKLRGERLGKLNEKCLLLTETSTQRIFSQIEEVQPEVIIIDSIQTLFSSFIDSAPGSISQIRECASEMLRYAKETNVPVILVGHITKDGNIAGPKILEHMVDTVIYFEGDRNHTYRLLRAIKNRFGSTNELGIFEMTGLGLKEVTDPSKVLTSNFEEDFSGVAPGCVLEGLRPMMIEVQSLVSPAVYGNPQRSATGFDLRRLNMLLAVLEKRCGFKLGVKDVFLNMAGGIKVEDPGLDLAVVIAILSSYTDISLDKGVCFAAEIGLSGEVRPVNKLDQRVTEAQKLGYKKIYISKYSSIKPKAYDDIEVIKEGKIEDIFSMLFG
ncbi:MAG: DNA repair protein RadA/Sms [Patiriisocius sp.]|jgi:DNA repair protein RadA/Sms